MLNVWLRRRLCLGILVALGATLGAGLGLVIGFTAEPVYAAAEPMPPRDDDPAPSAIAHAFRGFRLVGQPLIPQDEFADLFAAYSDRPITFEELQTLVLAVEALHHQHGYTLALAYLPEQVIDDGIVAIAVMPGLYGAIHLENHSRLRERVAQRALGGIPLGEPVHTPTLDAMVDLLDGLPGVAAWSAFTVGQRTGETDLIVYLEDEERFAREATLDATIADGEVNLLVSGTLRAFNPFGLGDEASLTLSTNGTNRASGRVGYQIRVGSAFEYLLSGSAALSRYTLDGEFAGLGGGGSSNLGLQLQRAWTKAGGGVTEGRASLERRGFHDDFAGSRSSSLAYVLQGALTWQPDNAGAGNRQTRLESDLRFGHFALGTPMQRFMDEMTARTQGYYALLRVRGEWARRIGNGHLSTSFAAQVANRNLPSFEKFSLAGGRGVQGLSGARTSGDDGWSLRLEYAFAPVDAGDFPGRVQYVPFVDMGGITYNKRPWDQTGRGSRLVYGAGIEARWAVSPGFDIRMHQGWLLHDTAGLVPPGQPGAFGLSVSVSF